MPSNYHNSLAKDAGYLTPISAAKAQLSPVLKNISIAALVGVITLTVVSSLIVAASRTSVNQTDNPQTEKTANLTE